MSFPFASALMMGSAASSTTKIQDVFDIDTWTGTGSSQAITTGATFAPDFVWIKCRNTATGHALFDRTRGAGAYIQPIFGTGSTDSTTLSSFGSTGYNLGTDGSGLVNTSTQTYVGWAFKEAAGFFDVVTYSGTGSVQSINHNLGTAPGLILLKRTSSGANWVVYHRSVGATAALELSATSAAFTSSTFFNDTAPTSTQFTLGTGSGANGGGTTNVAYLFGSDNSANGLVYCGSYTEGAGTTTVTLGWEPQFLLVKQSGGTGNWTLLDTTRGWTSGIQNRRLNPNTTGAESDAGATWEPTSTGFVAGSNGGAGTTWVYMAIRKGPM